MVIDPGNSNVNKNGVGTTSSQSSKSRSVGGDAPAEKANSTNTASASDTVSLSGAAKSMGQLEAKIADEPAVDSAKVAAIKQAIEEGSYNIDSDKIAQGMLSQDSMFG